MTIRELTALLTLYHAADEAARRKALLLLPELEDLIEEESKPHDAVVRLWKLWAHGNNTILGGRRVVCAESELPEHKRDFAMVFDLCTNVRVLAEPA